MKPVLDSFCYSVILKRPSKLDWGSVAFTESSSLLENCNKYKYTHVMNVKQATTITQLK